MVWKDRQRRFSIRKLKVAVASVVVGIFGFGAASPLELAQAQETLAASSQSLHGFDYRYVQESELTAEERARILAHLPSDKVGAYDQYYMVYRPVGHLPQTNGRAASLTPLLGAGLLLVGLTFVKRKKRWLVTSLLIVGLGEVTSVAALPLGGALSAYDSSHRLQVGMTIPETVIDIPNHRFVGYLLAEKGATAQTSLPASQQAVMRRVSDALTKSAPISSVAPVTSVPKVSAVSQSTSALQSSKISVSVSAQSSTSSVRLSRSQVFSQSFKPSTSSFVSVLASQSVLVSQSVHSSVSPSASVSQSVESSVDSSAIISAGSSTSQAPSASTSLLTSTSVGTSVSVSAQPSTSATPVSQSQVFSQSSKPSASSYVSMSATQSVLVSQSVHSSVSLSASASASQSVSSSVVSSTSVQPPRPSEAPKPVTPVEKIELESLAFETIYKEDPTLPLGSETVLQEGVPGQKRKRYVDGVLVAEEIVSQPVNRIVARGSKKADTPAPKDPVVTEEVEAIAFATDYREDPTLPLGSETVIQEGVPGQKRKRYVDGVLVSEEIVVQPVSRIIARGTKPATPDQPVSQPVVTTEPIPFETESIEDASLPLGQEVIVQAGVPGVREIKTLDGQVVSSQVIQAPVKQIVKRGTKVAPVTETRQVALPFETIYQDDTSLAAGQEAVIQEGQAGLAEQTWENGQLVAEKIVTQPVNRIIRRGTKVATPTEGTEVETSTVPIAPEVIRENDDSLWLGETQETPGTEGEKTITTTYITLDGVRQPNPTVTEAVTRPATPTLIKVGTKPVEGTETETETVEIDFKTVEELDDSKYTDEEVVRVDGEKGSKTVTTTYETIKGVRQPNPTVSEAMTKEAVDRVIVKGTKPIEGEVTEQSERPISFETQYEDDLTLLAGTEEVKQEGKDGLERVTLTYKTVKGVKTGQPTETVETLTPATPRIIRRGTKVETEADRQTPTLAATKQVVKVGETPDAKASIQTDDLKNVASYSWVTTPATDKVGTNLPGRVRVTYTDDSVDELDVTIDVIAKKEKPVLTYENLVEKDDEKKISLDYALEDPTSAYTGAVISIYDGETLVKQLPLSTMEAFDVTDLDWHVKYTLKTQYTYDLDDGRGPQIEDLAERTFELDYKHLEIKHVVSAGLYQKQADGSYLKLDNVKEVASDLKDYYVRVDSDKQRDIYLPVTEMVETLFDGKSVFKVTTTAPELIQYDKTTADNKADYSFYIRKFIPSSDGKYRTFSDLVNAIRADMTGTFEIDADLNADEVSLAADAVSYIAGEFRGRLLGHNHAILNLKAPLFDQLKYGFEVKDLDLKNVNINKPTALELGALGKRAYGEGQGGRISNVAAQGTIVGDRAVGGLVYRTNNVTLNQVGFEGNLTAMNGWQANFVGGLVGYAQNNTQIDGATTDVNIRVGMNNTSQRAGGLIGVLEHGPSRVNNVVAKGTLDNSAGTTTAYIGGLIGETIFNPQVSNALTGVAVTKGQMTLGNPANKPTGTLDIAIIDGLASGTADSYSTALTADEAKAKQDSMNLTVTLADSAIDYSRYEVDYGKVKQAKTENLLKYANVEKFMPLYNKEFIVKHGNRLADDHELATKTIVSIIPMAGDRFVANYGKDKTAIDQVMVYFSDGSKAYYKVSYLEDFKNTGVAEYQVQGLDLIYTPEQLLTTYPKLASEVLSALSSIEYYSDSLLTALGKTGNTQEMMDKLYLKESFDSIKANLADVLNGVLSTSDVMATDQTDVSAYILKNKEALIMGLAYVNRWYNIDFGDVNAKDLILYHQDLFGKSTNTLEWLVNIGKTYDQLRMINHLHTYDVATRAQSGYNNMFDYLSAYRKLFTNMDENTWFHAASKVYMAEGASEVRPDVEVRAYQRLFNDPEARKYILPFLTAKEGIYFITNMSTLNFGMYERYMDMSLKETNPTKYAEEVKRVEALIEAANKRYVDHFDFWYRMSLDAVKERNIKSVPNWDGYYLNRPGVNKDKWLPMFGAEANDAIKDFFGPLEGSLSSHYVGNGSGAYATGNMTRFVVDKILDNYGSSVHTHEMVHNSDANIYLGGYGRRFGQRAELFATGLLQAPTSHDSNYLSINTLFDYTGTPQADADNRYQPLSPDRFQTADDLQQYFHGVFDVLYTMDYLEAKAVLSLSKDQQRKFYNKIENYYVKDAVTNVDTHAGNQIRGFTDAEWNSMNLTSVMDLVDHDVVATRDYALSAAETAENLKKYGRNGYYTVSLFSPIYSALHNPTGAPGDIMFRLMAYELLAAKGYKDGFIPYTSDQFAAEALSKGITGTETWPSNHTVGRVTDDLVLEKVFNGQYASWKDFKKAMYQERIDKVDQLKAVTINFKGQDVVIDSVAKLEALMNEALQEDQTRFMGATTNIDANNRAYAQGSRVKELKAKIFNAYLRQTDDFKSSIYRGS